MENTENLENKAEVTSDSEPNKTIAILAYITLIGWIVAVVMNNEKKDAFASFHIRQMLGIGCTSLVLAALNVIPILGWTAYVLGMISLSILWFSGLINALTGKEKPVPLLGIKYQEWFKDVKL
ncbi:DUF4870 domain-containing protein [Myroides indicus]|uniref:Putative membrane protein n=1 Tax=Myroides indicus TaxID=1323422 RepID=A0A4R7EX24_9FLAO|nr:hypothetical protein [Myroides indicus]TDS58154.1 putative membrane protein [Myroides indicus]